MQSFYICSIGRSEVAMGVPCHQDQGRKADILQGQNESKEATSCGQWLAQMPPTSTLLFLDRPLGSVTLKALMR